MFWNGLELRDPAPVDLGISGMFLLAILCSLSAAVRHRGGPRLAWFGICGLLAVLLVNQQLDLHVPAMRAATSRYPWWREVVELGSALFPRDLLPQALALGALSAAALVLLLVWRWAAPVLVAVGLGLLAAHAAIRASMFAHLIDSSVAGADTTAGAKLLEVGGLLLITIAALVAKPAPQPGPARGAPAGQRSAAARR